MREPASSFTRALPTRDWSGLSRCPRAVAAIRRVITPNNPELPVKVSSLIGRGVSSLYCAHRAKPHKLHSGKSGQVYMKCASRVRTSKIAKDWCDFAVDGSRRDRECLTGYTITWRSLTPPGRWSGYRFKFVRRLRIGPKPRRPTRPASMSEAALGSGTMAAENDTGLSVPALLT